MKNKGSKKIITESYKINIVNCIIAMLFLHWTFYLKKWKQKQKIIQIWKNNDYSTAKVTDDHQSSLGIILSKSNYPKNTCTPHKNKIYNNLV